MNLNCLELLENISISTYFIELDEVTLKIKKLKILSYKGISHWTKESIENPDLLFKVIPKQDIEAIYKKLNVLKNQNYLEFKYKFFTKDNKIINIKSRLNVIERNNNTIKCLGINENISSEETYKSIFEKLKDSPSIGVLLYRDEIIYANEYLRQLLQLSNDKNYKLLDFINEDKNMLQKYIDKRKAGEDVFFYRERLAFISADYKRYYLNSYANTILYNGEYVGFALLTDETKEVKKEKILFIIREISEYILSILDKKELFDMLRKVIEEYYTCSIRRVYQEDLIIKEQGKVLQIPINNYILEIKSDYVNEFEYAYKNIYYELKKIIEFGLHNIENRAMLNILKEAIEKSYQWVMIIDNKGRILYVNDIVTKLSGYSKYELLGKNITIFKSAKHDEKYYKEMFSKIYNNKIFEDVMIHNCKNGDEIYLKMKIIPINVGDFKYFVTLGIDLTNERKLQQSLLSDDLTALLNRKGLLLKSDLKNEEYALLLIDIAEFKIYNQLYGTNYGDYVLKEFAGFLKAFFYEEDLIARIGGDKFAVLIKFESENQLKKIILRFINKLKSVDLNNLSVNVGISIYPKHAKDVNELIEKASVALSYAKKAGKNEYFFYDKNIKEKLKEVEYIKNLINKSLKEKKFIYYFQPYFSISDNKIIGAEALLRIKDDEKIISPGVFIDYAEQKGLIKDIEKIMYKKLLEEYMPKINIPVSFNISAQSFKDEEHIKILKNGQNLTIELTEREIAENKTKVNEIFKLLKQKDFRIAIDDFGSGYASFSYIKWLNFDILKIDMEYVKNITSPKDFAIVKTIITLAKQLNIKTIAEGVEYKEQMDILKKLECDAVQGYYFAKPMSFEKFLEFIKE